MAAVGCEGWVSWIFSPGLAFERGVKIFLLISLSWYCDWAVEETVEAEPLEAVGDDILFRCRWKGEKKVRYGPDLVRMDSACDARLVS